MSRVLPRKSLVTKKLTRYNLDKKFNKQIKLFEQNPYHPSLHTELLEPRKHGIYSFRIDRKFRALFIYRDDHSAIEILNITKHYE
jgi:Txe/YoeB family toxin of Txe-Axe toxin-antitoxin module